MTKFYLLLLGALLLVALPGRAQTVVSGYTCQVLSRAYTPLAGGTDLAYLNAHYSQGTVPLGFTFAIGGKFVTSAVVSSSGWLAMGSMYSYGYLTDPNYFYTLNVADWLAAPLWADLSGEGGQARYQTTGTAPNRVFTMEWRGWRWDAQATQASVSFQVRLYETTNRVEFAYQPEAGPVVASSGQAAAVVGLATSLGKVVVNDAGTAPTFDGYSAPRTTTRPPAGRVYAFVPQVVPACPAPADARLAELRRDNVKVTWYNPHVGGTYTVHYGKRGFVAGGPDDHAIATGAVADTAQLTGLALSTNYEFYVEQNCGVGAPGRSPRVAFQTSYQPFNDEGYRAQLLPLVTTANLATQGTTFEATPSLPAGTCGTGTDVVRDVWYRFSPEQPHQRLLLAQLYDRSVVLTAATVLEVRDGWSAGSRLLGCVVGSDRLYTDVELTLDNLVVGKSYFVRVYSRLPGTSGIGFRVARLATGPPPANDACANATLLPPDLPYGSPPLAGTLRFATPTTLPLGYIPLFPEPDVWYSFVARAGQEFYFRSTFQAVCGLYEANCDTLTGPPVTASGFAAQANKAVRYRPVGLKSGTRYLLRIVRFQQYFQEPVEDFELGLTAAPPRPPNDDCAAALPLVPDAPALAGTVGGARPTAGLPPATSCQGVSASLGQFPNPDAWYRFTAPSTPVTLTLASNFLAQLEVRPGTCASPGASLACAFAQPAQYAFSAQPGQVLLTALTPGTQYLVRVLSLQPDSMAAREFTLALATAPARPANDEPANAIELPISPQTAPLQNTLVGNLAGATPSLAGDSRPDIWYKLTLPSYPVALRAVRDAGLSVLACEGPPYYTTHDGTGGQPNVRDYPRAVPLNWAFKAGQVCYVRITPVGTPTQAPPPWPDFEIGVAPIVANDEPCGALPLPLSVAGGCTQPVHGTTLGATFNRAIAALNPALNCTLPPDYSPSPDVWYRFTATSPALTVRCADVQVQQLRVFERPVTCADDLTLVGCQSVYDGTETAIGAAAFDNLVAGREYLLAVSGFGFASTHGNEFTLCAEASATLPTRPAASAAEIGLWPNPVEAGELLNVQVPAGSTTLRAEWLSVVGQRLGAEAALPVAGGQAQVPTAGRAPGLYLLRLWWQPGQPPVVRRVLVR